eukprot:CAMPEP_0174694980 /NCGR_PEP_ID=MMETSP1094-20130205/1449_1 /TAXON_ID=156173 /ORGANISM="Chrysochromulina brevifilum, Strain UTEX LB 985" /LENGTH=114 /DNA_ID=CAMNT_0015891357 /DNA_START=76 /DNA_END=420 /DNA_ORIENTATION=+
MAHDPKVRLIAQDGLAVIAKIALKLEPVLLHKCPYGHMHKLWWFLFAVAILPHKELVALSILTVRCAFIPVSVNDPPAHLDSTNGSFFWKSIFFGGLVTLALCQKEPVRTLALL